jgi:hypothetical protein
MTALAQGSAGLALVIGFALLCIRQTGAASILLALQSAAVAMGAVAVHQPIIALPPVALASGIWFARSRTNSDPRTQPVGGAKLGVGAGAILAILCQSLGNMGLPLAVVLLALLLAATRTHPLMRTMALVAVQNGIVLAACLGFPPAFLLPSLLPFACLVLPLPLAAGLLIPAVTGHGTRTRAWLGWTDLALSLAVFAATFVVPLDPIASVFAPLLGLDCVMRSEARRKRHAGIEGLAPHATRFGNTIAWRGLALANSVFLVLAVCAPNQIIAWLAVLAAMATALLPTLRRRWDQAVLANLGAGILLLGLLLVSATPSVVGYFSLFAGFAAISAVVPDLAAVSVILLLRLAIREHWPPAAEALGVGIALIALLSCAILLIRGRRPIVANVGEWATHVIGASSPGPHPGTAESPTIFTGPPPQLMAGWANPEDDTKANAPSGANIRASALMFGPMASVPRSAAKPDTGVALNGDRVTLILLSQAGIAALAICMGQADGRFAALVLLILLILTRSAARITHGPIATLALAGLAGVPPLGVFPGVVLVVLAMSGQDAWLLLPLGLAAIPIFLAGVPRHFPNLWSVPALRSIFWVPLVLAVLVGYFAPDGLSHWWHIITAGRS